MASKNSRKDCSRCSRSDGEAFWCMKNRFIFDIDKAREFAGDGRDKIELEPDDVEFSVGRCEINEGHLEHVDPSIPGIVAHIYFPDEGQVVHGHRLIDGHHRAARCLQLGIPYYVYVLSEEESVEILMKAPKGARPKHLRQSKRIQAKKSRGKKSRAEKRRATVAVA